MPRPRKAIRPVTLNMSLDEDLAAKMKLELFSEVEGRVPHGAQSKFINQVLRKHFRSLEAKRRELARRQQVEGASKAIDEALAGSQEDQAPPMAVDPEQQ